MRQGDWTRFTSGLAMVLVLAGCATQAAAPTTTPTVAPSSAPAGPQGLFTGHDHCTDPDAEGAPDTGVVNCDRVVTDPRMTGTLTSGGAGLGTVPDLYTEWRTFTMTNDGGMWFCDQLLIGRSDSSGRIDQVCTGARGYEGLTAYVQAISGNGASDWGVLGWIEEWSEASP